MPDQSHLISTKAASCRALRTDIATLQSLTDCQVILHIPHKNHFVLLGDIDSESIWTIDLAGRKFCSRADASFFGMDWTDGTALLISDAPIAGALDDIGNSELANITGRGGYSCDDPIQDQDYTPCYYGFGDCPNTEYRYQPERWGCRQAPSGMCIEDWKLRLATCPCVLNSGETGCEVTGDWQFGFCMACY